MIIVRDVMHVKFGMMRNATEAWKTIQATASPLLVTVKYRVLTDLNSSSHTLIFESEHPSLAVYEDTLRKLSLHELVKSNALQETTKKFFDCIETSSREIYTILD